MTLPGAVILVDNAHLVDVRFTSEHSVNTIIGVVLL